ncbi:aminotransferase class I/II-fold pyridoxal phosphate-dependent enzyme [Thermoleophilia bacterium SCSIO 60948]|nr:aminotransferase class I/II-fold pyridoxal phosphate-dependent enzyme [Thermoleophilia bacterium SCSIO 60948]
MVFDRSRLIDLDEARLRERTSAKWAYYGDALPAWVAEMDFPLADPVRDALRAAVDRDDAGYAFPDASDLGGSFARFASRRLGWELDPGSVIAVSDVVVGVTELVRVLDPDAGGTIITTPVYHPFFEVVPEAGSPLIQVPLDSSGDLDLDAIEAELASGARVVILCSPHNPVGRVVPRDDLVRLAELAESHDAWVISDEIHAPLLMPGSEHHAFTTVSEAAARRGVVLSSASKAFNVAGLKCAVAVAADGPARERLERIGSVARHVGHLGVIASVAAFDAGDEWLDAVIAVLDENRRRLADLLAERLPDVRYRPPDASFLAWLDMRGLALGADPAELCLVEAGIALSPGPQFGREGEGFARLNFATSPAILERIVGRIADAVASTRTTEGSPR